VPPAAAAVAAGNTAGAAGGGADADDDTDGAVVLGTADADYDTAIEYRARISRVVNKKGIDLCTGVLKVQSHKTDGTKRMVMRNAAGAVLFNTGINSQMGFNYKKGKKMGYITFMGLNASDDKPGIFTITSRLEASELLFPKLKEFSS